MCCKDCTKRYIGCHSNCDDYKQFKKEKELLTEEIRKQKNKNDDFRDYRIQKAYKIQKAKWKGMY